MIQQEYDQKKHECWEEFCKEYPHPNADMGFNYAFDRAYALGKEKETITQEEIEKAAEKYDDQHTEKLIHDMHNDSKSWEPLQDGIRNAFLAGANYALGKQTKDADAVIQGWIVRDKDGTLNLFYGSDKPIKRGQDEYWSVVAGAVFEYLPIEMFPDLTWESDPLPVEIILKRKKK